MKQFEEDDGSEFAALLGSFGTHADVDKRARAERMAAMRPNDKRRRRGPARVHQFNVRITEVTQSLAAQLCKNEEWSQADLVETAISALARQKGIAPDA